MSEQTAQEPTMEEILASIRRIISEDDAPAGQAAAPAETQAEAPAPELAPEPAPEPVAAAEPEEVSPAMMDETPSTEDQPEEEVLELTEKVEEPSPYESVGDLDVAPRAEPQPAPEPAFVAPTPQFQAGSVPAAGGTTIEELVRSILEPQIRAWADQNLDGIMRETMREVLRVKMDEKLERVFK